jgi:acyl-CoA reductase-like NAD-dependent aldehyde dehydrogenase
MFPFEARTMPHSLPHQKLFLAGRWEATDDAIDIVHPFSGERVATVSAAASTTAVEATAAAVAGFEVMRRLSAYARGEILKKAAASIGLHREEFARVITGDNGKPLRQSRTEVDRAMQTFTAAAEEATRICGETIPLDVRRGTEGRFGVVRRFPVGPVLGIAPFNYPLNLVAHKVAPALAAGCSIVLKPASRTPRAALLLAKVLEEAGLPPGGLSVIPCSRHVGDLMVQDDTFKLLSFTGSPEVGFELKAKAGKKPVVLELGGNAAAIVHKDADLEHAVRACVMGAFTYSGQVCISVQRIFVQDSIFDAFADRFVKATGKLVIGDPMEEITDVGPMIDDENAARIEQWIHEAKQHGARVLAGGERRGRLVDPTVLTEVDRGLSIDCREAFGPVVNLHRYKEFDEAIAHVNDSRYGLQAGVFTRDLGVALRAYDHLDVGAVILNDAPTFRVDTMPYGGTKDSGLGREGVRYAIEHCTSPRLLAVHAPYDG